MNQLIVTTSWDDGTVTDLELAQILEKYGIRGTFYISRSRSDNLLPKEDIVAIDRTFEVGAHTLSHLDLTLVSISEAKKEIESSKNILEDLLGHNISMFCYPYGRYNDEVMRIVKDCGFIAARTCDPGGFDFPKHPYQWHVTLFASNGSPLMALRIWWKFHLWKVSSLLDWESRAKSLFDLALKEGGIYHMYGHSPQYGRNNEWNKLERVFSYISRREGVQYMTNRESFESYCQQA